MKRQQTLKQRLQTLAALRDAVGAMRSLAAHHFRRARQALMAARDYRTETDTVLAEAGIHWPLDAAAPAGLLVVASDLGLCGDYNSRLSRQATAAARQRGTRLLYCVGRRSRTALSNEDLAPDRAYDAPASLEGLTRLLRTLTPDIMDDFLARRFGSLFVVSAAFEGVGHFTPVITRLLPIEPVATAAPVRPSNYVDPPYLAMVAVREFLYITLYEILLDAMAAEHGMRLMAADSALDWLDDTASATARQLAGSRSEASTQELLDIISGSRRKNDGSMGSRAIE